MLFNPFLAQRLAEGRIKDALREAEQAQLIRAGKGPRKVRQRHLPVHFILGCQVDTSKRRWEPMIGREKYRQWRDALIKVGWTEWINPYESGQDWRLTRPAWEIMEIVFLT